jgi:hypothetical protein
MSVYIPMGVTVSTVDPFTVTYILPLLRQAHTDSSLRLHKPVMMKK